MAEDLETELAILRAQRDALLTQRDTLLAERAALLLTAPSPNPTPFPARALRHWHMPIGLISTVR
jgi:hypothetical protein